MPTAPRLCGSALQEWQCPLPPCCVAVHSLSCTTQCPQAMRHCIEGVPLPEAMRQCIARAPRPTAHKHCGGA